MLIVRSPCRTAKISQSSYNADLTLRGFRGPFCCFAEAAFAWHPEGAKELSRWQYPFLLVIATNGAGGKKQEKCAMFQLPQNKAHRCLTSKHIYVL